MKKIIAMLLVLIGLSVANVPYQYVSYRQQMELENAANVITNVNKKVSYPEAFNIAKSVYEMTQETMLEFPYVMGLMMTESRFNYKAKSYCGAMGLMQIMPSTFKAVVKENGLDYTLDQAYDIEKNIHVGVLFLDKLFRKYGHLDYVSASYNGGPRAARNYKSGQFENVPKETMNYISKVKQNKKHFALVFKIEL